MRESGGLARGHNAIWDRHEKIQDSGLIARLVAGLATCHYFLMVIDERSVERVGEYEGESTDKGWVYVEYRIAQLLVDAFGIRMLGLVRQGGSVPRGMTLSDGVNPGTAFSVDTPEKLKFVLDTLTPASVTLPKRDRLIEVRSLLEQSYDMGAARDYATAFQLAHDASRALPDVADVQYRLCLPAVAVTRLDIADAASDKAAILDPTSTFIRYARILTLLILDDADTAVPLIREIATLFAGSWRLKLLQLGMDVARGERYAMESCARSAARLCSPDIGTWALRWRERTFGIGKEDLKIIEFDHGQPLPIDAGETWDSHHHRLVVHQVDKAAEFDGSGFRQVPSVHFEPGALDQLNHLWNLDIALLAHAAAK